MTKTRMTSPVPAGPAAAWMPAVAAALAKMVSAAIPHIAITWPENTPKHDPQHDHAEDPGDDGKPGERSDPGCGALPAAAARAPDQPDQRRGDVAAEHPRDHRVERRGPVGILERQRLDVGDLNGWPVLRGGDAVERLLQRDGGRPVRGRRDEEAVRGRLVGTVDLAIVDLRQRIGAGRGQARIERVTGQAVELSRDRGRPDDGYRHVVWRRIVEGADVEEREREHQHQRRKEHELRRPSAWARSSPLTPSSAIGGRVSMWVVPARSRGGATRFCIVDQTRIRTSPSTSAAS